MGAGTGTTTCRSTSPRRPIRHAQSTISKRAWRRTVRSCTRWSTMPGISPKTERGTRLNSIETSLDTWRHVYQVNFFAPIMLARGLFDELERAQGAVVNVTSIAGSRVHPFAGSAYATSKAALAALTREMAADFGPRGIRVNSISPGEIDTSILSPGTGKIVEEQIPMHRLGSPEEVARRSISYAASNRATCTVPSCTLTVASTSRSALFRGGGFRGAPLFFARFSAILPPAPPTRHQDQ